MNENHKNALLLTSFIGVMALAVIVYFYFMVGRANIKKSHKQAAALETDIKELNKELEEIADIMSRKDEVDELHKTIKKMQLRLPSSPDAPGFLQALVEGLATTGIIQEVVNPGKTTNRDLYTEIPYNIKAHGYYHSYGQFLTLIEQNPTRFMRVKTMTLGNNADRPSIHPIELELATFMFNKGS